MWLILISLWTDVFEAVELDMNHSFSEKTIEEKKKVKCKENGEEMENKLGWWNDLYNVTVQPFSELLLLLFSWRSTNERIIRILVGFFKPYSEFMLCLVLFVFERKSVKMSPFQNSHNLWKSQSCTPLLSLI